MLIIVLAALPTTQYKGYCRYESATGEQTWGKIQFGKEVRSAEHCYKKCKDVDGTNGQEKCTAFSYSSKDGQNYCDTYKDGPYTEGDVNIENATCYIMPKGNPICYYCYM